tara:strand:- start:101 stop:904 length:804 start_codon:yes stop_codon:yes gene_type:complete
MKSIFFICFVIVTIWKLYPQSINEYKKLALQGNKKAQIHLAQYFSSGEKRDLTEAYYWTKMAALNGSTYACRLLGIAHLNAKGTSFNPQAAKTWFLQAAKKGDQKSMNYLAVIHKHEKNIFHSIAWYMIAHDVTLDQAKRSYSEIINELSSEEKISIIELSKSLSSNIKKGNDENTFETTQRSKKILTIHLNESVSYTGEVYENLPNGYGKKYSQNGIIYMGEFKDGMEHGYGTSFDVHGIISYQGIWDMGNPTLKNKLNKRGVSNY